MQQVYPLPLPHFQPEKSGVGAYIPYQPTTQRPDTETDPLSPTTETALLRQKVELLERIIQGIENERNDLRRRLDAESEARENAAAEIRRLALMFTHPPKPEPDAQPAPTANQNDRPAPVRPWLWVALAAVLIMEPPLLYGWPMAASCPDI